MNHVDHELAALIALYRSIGVDTWAIFEDDTADHSDLGQRIADALTDPPGPVYSLITLGPDTHLLAVLGSGDQARALAQFICGARRYVAQRIQEQPAQGELPLAVEAQDRAPAEVATLTRLNIRRAQLERDYSEAGDRRDWDGLNHIEEELATLDAEIGQLKGRA